MPGRGHARGQHDACSASAGTHLPEGQKMCRNGPDYVNNLVSHMILAVTQWSLTDERLGFLSLLMGSHLCKMSHESPTQGPLQNQALLT